MKKYSISRGVKPVVVAGLVAALAGGTGAVFALAEPHVAFAAQQQSSQELCELVNPVLQSYVPAQDGGTWKLGATSRLVIDAVQDNVSNKRLAEVVELINAELANKQLVSKALSMVYAPAQSAVAGDIVVDLAPVDEITQDSTSDEAYKIEITADGTVHVIGASENAVLYGLRTIEDILITNKGAVPAGTIVDYPNLEERRLFVDCGRKYFSKDWFIREIHEMSYMKLNTLDIHFSENLGFRLECDTDPAIVSEQYLTKEEMLDILNEARLYGINVIPSIDSPGHVDQILKVHPEYGQIANDGTTHYDRGLDITNPEAVAYIRSIYKEYIDLFKQGGATTDISIGCDEYMEFDRPPFTTMYQSVLEDWAHEHLGADYSWTDTLATYINDLAQFCRDEGLEPRVFNDALYYGEGSSSAQKIELLDGVGVDFWSQMSWNSDIANLQDLLNRGVNTLYNFNANYGYFVLRNDDRGASFDFDDSYERWWNNWRPGDFQDAQNAHVLSDDDPRIKGTAIAIWCDYPDVATEDEIADGIADELRAMASRSWNVDSNKEMSLDEFSGLTAQLGHAPAWNKGERLPDVGEVVPAENVGTVRIHCVDKTGKALRDDIVNYGEIGTSYTVNAPEIYGYRLVGNNDTVSGTYTKEGSELTFIYELYAQKSALAQELAKTLIPDLALSETYTEVPTAFGSAREVFEDANATQQQVDDALKALQEASNKSVLLNRFGLYAECTYPLSNAGYSSGYEAYEQALEAGRTVLYNAQATAQDVRSALQAIRTAKEGLVMPTDVKPSVSATDTYYTLEGGFPYGNMIDANPSTKCWFNVNQEVGKEVVFSFPTAVLMSSIAVSQPQNVGADAIKAADVQISSEAAGDSWVTVGSLSDSASDLTSTFSFDAQKVQRVRIVLTAAKNNWYQISEVSFATQPIEENAELAAVVEQAEDLDVAGKSSAAVQRVAAAVIGAQRVLTGSEHVTSADTNVLDASSALSELQAAMTALASDTGKDTDLADLKAFRESVSNLKEADYTAQSWKGFKQACDQADRLLAAGWGYQDASNEAFTTLRSTYFQLAAASGGTDTPDVTPGTVNKDELAGKIQDLEAEGLKEGNYTAESWAAYVRALAAARAVLSDEHATQEQVDSALAALVQARAGLVAAEGNAPVNGTYGSSQPSSNGVIPATGDPAALAAVAGVSGMVLAGLGGLQGWLRRKR